MSDVHFRIAKRVKDGRTVTTIEKLSEEESIEELSRILGGTRITDAVRRSAQEMREMARKADTSVSQQPAIPRNVT